MNGFALRTAKLDDFVERMCFDAFGLPGMKSIETL
ncbi:hypothetical protein M527_12680 [Sphingobium indicum IP26]|nr:hypothetical protein M527_12680 [Sphingobium indicum IP26]